MFHKSIDAVDGQVRHEGVPRLAGVQWNGAGDVRALPDKAPREGAVLVVFGGEDDPVPPRVSDSRPAPYAPSPFFFGGTLGASAGGRGDAVAGMRVTFPW